jgi:hypothetical protein
VGCLSEVQNGPDRVAVTIRFAKEKRFMRFSRIVVLLSLLVGMAAGTDGQFFPGLLYVDALELDIAHTESLFRSDIFLRSISVSKPIVLFIDGKTPDTSFFANESGGNGLF